LSEFLYSSPPSKIDGLNLPLICLGCGVHLNLKRPSGLGMSFIHPLSGGSGLDLLYHQACLLLFHTENRYWVVARF
jgi:hypothetical protein